MDEFSRRVARRENSRGGIQLIQLMSRIMMQSQ